MPIKQKKGFTLPELLMAAAILSYSLVMVLASFIGSVALNEANRNLSIATSHAQFAMESIRNTSFASVATSITAGNFTWNTAGVANQGLTALKGESLTTTYTGSTLLDITVTVSWSDANGRTRSKILETLVSS
jgi:prepilin-type N-terminal cleavage/methylation domain-containing protein